MRLGAFGGVWNRLGASGIVWMRLEASASVWKRLGASGCVGKRLQAFSSVQLNAYETYTINALPVQMLGQDSQKWPFRSRGPHFLGPLFGRFLDPFLVDFGSIFGRFWVLGPDPTITTAAPF